MNKAKALELLGEKKELLTDYSPWNDLINKEGKGYNQMHSKAVDVVVGLLERIKESEEQRLNDKESIASLTKSCKEAIRDWHFAQALIKELKSTNDK